jgi:alkylglycerol monooxygenase
MKDLAGLAGPAYFVLIAVELFVAKRRGLSLYRLNDAISNVSTGLLMQLTVLTFGGIIAAGYITTFEGSRIADWSPDHLATWACCFLAVDFAYYWFHRLSHEVNFLWAAHAVHHQSEDYNLAVALRQSTLQPFFSAVVYLPLAVCGFPPLVFFACSGVNTIYQFWLHTQLVGKLGPLESVLVTPSHHRVHHGRNPIYIDRNHGGTFIIWDRLFGTFQREEEEVVYWEAPSVLEFSQRATDGVTGDREQATRLFYAVRDGLRYDPYTASHEAADYRASAIVQMSSTYCAPKAILLTAAGR